MLVFKYKSRAKIYNYILVSSTVKKHFANIGLFSPYIRRAKKRNYAYARYTESQKEIHLTLIYATTLYAQVFFIVEFNHTNNTEAGSRYLKLAAITTAGLYI